MSVQWPHQTWGNSQFPPLLMLHGFMGSSNDWHPIAQTLLHKYFCIAPDLPGHGEHIHLNLDKPLDLATAARELIVWLKSQAWTPLAGLGYSLGGRLLLHAAINAPSQFHALILEGASPGIENEEARQVRCQWDDANAEALTRYGMKPFVDDWYKLELFQSLQRHPELLSNVKAARSNNDAAWMAKLIRDFSPGRNLSLWPQLSQLPMRALFLAGELDAKYSELGQRAAHHLPQGQFQLIENAGHNAHLEQPGKFSTAVQSFLSNL